MSVARLSAALPHSAAAADAAAAACRAFYPSWLMAEICRRLRQEAGVLALHGMHETGISREEGKSTGNPHHQGCGIAMSGFNPDRAKE